MNRLEAMKRRCPFQVAETCLVEGCMAWSAASDLIRRIDAAGAEVGLDRDREARRQQHQLRDAGFSPIVPSTKHHCVNGEQIPLNWRKSSGDIGECARLRAVPTAPAVKEEP